MHVIGEDASEMLDIVPAVLRVRVVRRPRYGCRACEEAVVQAPAPERPVTGGMATEALLAHVLVAKYGDFLPLYRQAGIFARQGIELDRSTLCDWVGRACWWLEPLWRLLRRHVMSSTRIFADDTTLPVLDPGRGRTKTGRLWGYAIDDRPWGGSTPPAVVYLYAEDRKGEHPAAHLAEFRGILQVDGYGGFKSLLENRPPGEIRLAFCWAHCRRRFYEIHQATGSPLAEEALRRIGELYKIEAEVRGRPAEERRAARQERSKPLVDALHAWLTAQLGRVSGKSGLAEAIRYALRHWQGLVLFLDDGRLELDTNTIERAIRPIALGRKNACSPARTCWRHNAAVHGRQADWARISHRGHADLGQVVRVVRRMTRDGAVILVVKLPDGRSERVPLSWTETAPDGPTMPALLFSPSSLRALVRLVREHGIPPSAETDHGGRGIPDLEAPARRRSRRGGGAVGGTPAPPAGRPPGEEHGGEP